MPLVLRLLLCCLGWVVLSIAPVAAQGLTSGQRDYKPVIGKGYANHPLTLDQENVTLGSLLGEEGLVLVMLTDDPGHWDWDMLERMVNGRGAETFSRVRLHAIYPSPKHAKYAHRELDHLAGFMEVSVIDKKTRIFLPEAGDQVLLALFSGPKAIYRGSYRTLIELATEL